MKIYMIWAQDKYGYKWMMDAWDDDSVSDNRAGWEAAIKKAEGDGYSIRVITADLDFDAVDKAFETPSAGALIVEQATPVVTEADALAAELVATAQARLAGKSYYDREYNVHAAMLALPEHVRRALPRFHPYAIPRFEGDAEHCRHPACPETNWSGNDRVHARGTSCPPLKES